MVDYPDGIFFGLPEDEYLAIERLSKSGLKDIRVSPADFWAGSWLNKNKVEMTPEQEKRRAIARLLGRAYHCARLEPDRFHDAYVREISQADYAGVEGFVGTGSAIEAALAARDLPKKFKDDTDGVLSQARRLREAGHEGPIWHLEYEAWEQERGERSAIPANLWDQIIIDMKRIRKVSLIDELLTGGEAEVSILYTCPDTGIPMKARLDFLRPADWTEFKTFANQNRKNLYQALIDAVQFNRYHIDAASQLQSTEAIRHGLPIIGDSTAAQRELVEAIQLRDAELACHFVFQQKDDVPNVLTRQFRFWNSPDEALRELERDGANEEHLERARKMASMMTRTRTKVYARAAQEMAAAKRTFITYRELYEDGEEWLPFDPGGEISDLDFREWWLDEAVT